jgi:AraC-like DNA-binding protein/mannose-6-phosphate isomerase-like protein (cupin superfamily)
MAVSFYYNQSKIQLFKVFSGTLNETVQMHSHTKNGYELHLIDYGSGTLITENNKYELTKNILYVTGPNVLHKQTPNFENPMHELCVYFRIPSTKNGDNIVLQFASRTFWIGKSNAETRRIFKQMVEISEKNDIMKDSILSSLAIRLIVEITRLYFPSQSNNQNSNNDSDLNESRSWILDQLLLEDCSNVKLEDFAKEMGVCPRQAERIIKDYYGSSFKKLRYEAKMAMAATLLEQKQISIEDCALQCGYSSATAFTSAFKRKYNITPKQYKNNFKRT